MNEDQLERARIIIDKLGLERGRVSQDDFYFPNSEGVCQFDYWPDPDNPEHEKYLKSPDLDLYHQGGATIKRRFNVRTGEEVLF